MTLLCMIVDRYMQMVYGGLGALIFSVYLVYGVHVSMSTYVMQEVSLGPCIAPFIKFVQYCF